MKRRLQRIYWVGILLTLVVAAAAIVMLVSIKIGDTQEDLYHTLSTASEWTLESDEDLQELADSIASVAPPVRVTFLMNHGLVLADSILPAVEMENHMDRPEIIEAMRGEIGESLRMSETQDVVILYAAKQISPQLILRLGYPIRELTQLLLWYGAGLVVLFLILFVLQRRSLSHFANSLVTQMDDVRRLLEGDKFQPKAVFPELQPAMNNIAYLIERMESDRQEILRTQNLRSDFVANASHELRSPLTSIMGFAEMLDEGLADSPEEQALCTQMIRSECDRMLEVIEDILLLNRSERQAPQNTRPVNVANVAREICRSLAPRAAEKHISLQVIGELTLQAVEKDIWEVLYNLSDNAVRYGREGGYVHIRLSENKIAVEDNGIGIDKAHQARIFEQFYRVDEMRDSAVRGTGMGLSIVRAIVQRYGGDVSVESEPGSGSCFTACFATNEEKL